MWFVRNWVAESSARLSYLNSLAGVVSAAPASFTKGVAMNLETVKIVCSETNTGYMIINKSDFDPETMTEFDAEVADAPKPAKKTKKADE
jgi:hypothetical protein